MSFKIHKDQKLKSEKAIASLFSSGKSLFFYPVKLQYRVVSIPQNEKPGLKFTVSVSKKNFKRAVDRNLLKRRIREAFRLEKNPLEQQVANLSLRLECMFIFVGKNISDYAEIHKGVKISTYKLETALKKHVKQEKYRLLDLDENREMI